MGDHGYYEENWDMSEVLADPGVPPQDLPDLKMLRGGIRFHSSFDGNGRGEGAAGLTAASGWCAPSEQVYNISGPLTEAQIIESQGRQLRALKAERKALRKQVRKLERAVLRLTLGEAER